MKALLIGGPKNGRLVEVRAGQKCVVVEIDNCEYVYNHTYFALYEQGGLDAVWPFFLHGEMPVKEEVLSLIDASGIHAIGRTSALPLRSMHTKFSKAG